MNLLKTIHFDHPDSIPMTFHVNDSCWHHYNKEKLYSLMASHPLLFPDLGTFDEVSNPVFPDFVRKNSLFTDPWGCKWKTNDDGIIGAVIEHPLGDWKAFDDFIPPDPEISTHWSPINWGEAASSKSIIGFFSSLNSADIGHGHTFLKLIDIRGYENSLLDMSDNDPRILRLLDMITEFNLGLVNRYIEKVGVEFLGYAEDLGMEIGPMLSPSMFKKYILPAYRQIIKPAKNAGVIVHMHSDGDLKALFQDIESLNLNALNLQDLVNGIEWIRNNLKGKICIDLDIDRQKITVNGTPGEIHELIDYEVKQLSDPAGGLMMIYGLYPGVPLENAAALMEVMENHIQSGLHQ
ncbi:MAG: hypothetical protein KAH21_12575 [Spirochaetaceae bacterium]|nr:hypothetical protein [Spirochaetaceae bacterium]